MRNRFTSCSWLKIAGPLLAMRLRRNARKDEKNGTPFTAAMEWREAARLCAPINVLADRCWREWERIMHLPRQMAAPIGEVSIASCEARRESGIRTDQHVVVSSASLLTAA